MKYNPFQPNKIVNPAMFVGRIDELEKIESYLFQAKSGNPTHFLIEGERGIGKSSLLKYVAPLANGNFDTPDGYIFKFLVVFVDLGSAHTQLDIIRIIARELKSQIGKVNKAKEIVKSTWEFLSNWEILGVRYHKEAGSFDPEDAKDNLVEQLEAIATNAELGIDGILVMLDEADAPPVEAHLGNLMKAMTEKLSREGCDNVIFGLAGLPSLLGKLKASHESSARIFTVLRLETLDDAERIRVIDIGIGEANTKNDFATAIDGNASKLLADMSEGYPHFIQQFGYCAFEADVDNKITIEDVLSGAHNENGAIAQLGRKYFSEMYFSKINSNDYRKLLDAMSKYSDRWVSRKQLIADTRMKESTVNNALLALKQKSIIILDESRQGFYRLPTKSFAAWINAIKSVDERRGGSLTSQSEVG
ncbi:ATP-binding protein [Sphingomonas sp. NY01]|uniref:ATP-binding protein n=1 Tax=Sphingomonas sp. NY01 TaxID=2968057 RepID=UPI00315D41DB